MTSRNRPGVSAADGERTPEAIPPQNEDDRLPTTPPPEIQTDPSRGTGELGEEELDPSKPLSHNTLRH
jgi:hypothetical protein